MLFWWEVYFCQGSEGKIRKDESILKNPRILCFWHWTQRQSLDSTCSLADETVKPCIVECRSQDSYMISYGFTHGDTSTWKTGTNIIDKDNVLLHIGVRRNCFDVSWYIIYIYTYWYCISYMIQLCSDCHASGASFLMRLRRERNICHSWRLGLTVAKSKFHLCAHFLSVNYEMRTMRWPRVKV